MISERAKILISNPSPIVTAASKCMEDPYSIENPNGYLNFGVAQNFLMEDEIRNIVLKYNYFEHGDIHYNEVYGKESLRTTFCNFAHKYLNTPTLNPENITIQCGVSALCESLAYALFNKGDTLLMAAPYYPGFFYDFTLRFGVNIETVQLKKENQFKHVFDDFKKRIDETNPKAILLTNPYNPTGEVLTSDFQDQIVEYCKIKNIHIITDEIYTLTRLDNKTHHSFLNYDYQNIHYLYGMAKDFSLAGLKVGFFYSQNTELSRAMQNISYFHTVSTQTQNAVKNILNDFNFIEKYISTYQKRLKEALKFLEDNLKNIDFVVPEGGFFILGNFQNYLKDKSSEAELDFFNYMMNEFKINMNPAFTMGFNEPGYFRICYAKKEFELKEFCKRINKLKRP